MARKRASSGEVKPLVFDVMLFFVLVLLLSFLYQNNLLLTIVLAVFGLTVTKFFPHKNDLWYFFPAAILGSLGEVIAVSYGVWQYANPTLAGVPLWLPLGWGLSAMIAIRVSHDLIQLRGKA